MGNIRKIHDSAAVFLYDRKSRTSVIPCSIRRIFLPRILHGQYGRLRHTDCHQRTLHFLMQITELLFIPEPPAIIKMLHLAVFHNAHQITHFFVKQMKLSAFFMKYDCHNLPFHLLSLLSAPDPRRLSFLFYILLIQVAMKRKRQ